MYIGDPADRSLRQVEKDLSIGKMRRNYAFEVCDPIVKSKLCVAFYTVQSLCIDLPVDKLFTVISMSGKCN